MPFEKVEKWEIGKIHYFVGLTFGKIRQIKKHYLCNSFNEE